MRIAVWLLVSFAVYGCTTPPPEPTMVEAPAETMPQTRLLGPYAHLSPRLAQVAGRLPPLLAAQNSSVSPQSKRVIGLLVPLSGRGQAVGEALRDAALMALFDASDPRLDLRIFDTQGMPEGARVAAQAAVTQGADILLGPLFGENIQTAAPIARAARIKIIGFSNDAAVSGDGVYLLSFPPEEQVARVIQFAGEQGARVFGALIPTSVYGDRVLSSLGRAVARTQGRLANVQSYAQEREALQAPVQRLADYDRRKRAHDRERAFLKRLGADDFAAEILEDLEQQETLGNLPLDAVMLPEGLPLIRSLAPLLPFYDIDPGEVQILGTGLWDGVPLGGELALRGAWYAAPDPGPVEAYMTRFEGLYGYRPPRLATLGYDAMALMALLARDFTNDPFADASMQNRQGFTGIDGLFRFLPDGRVQRGLAVVQIEADDVSIIDPAPQNFYALD